MGFRNYFTVLALVASQANNVMAMWPGKVHPVPDSGSDKGVPRRWCEYTTKTIDGNQLTLDTIAGTRIRYEYKNQIYYVTANTDCVLEWENGLSPPGLEFVLVPEGSTSEECTGGR